MLSAMWLQAISRSKVKEAFTFNISPAGAARWMGRKWPNCWALQLRLLTKYANCKVVAILHTFAVTGPGWRGASPARSAASSRRRRHTPSPRAAAALRDGWFAALATARDRGCSVHSAELSARRVRQPRRPPLEAGTCPVATVWKQLGRRPARAGAGVGRAAHKLPGAGRQ